jgi:hypothetical protein
MRITGELRKDNVTNAARTKILGVIFGFSSAK